MGTDISETEPADSASKSRSSQPNIRSASEENETPFNPPTSSADSECSSSATPLQQVKPLNRTSSSVKKSKKRNTNILPNRCEKDIARDKKRILEICYGSDSDEQPSSFHSKRRESSRSKSKPKSSSRISSSGSGGGKKRQVSSNISSKKDENKEKGAKKKSKSKRKMSSDSKTEDLSGGEGNSEELNSVNGMKELQEGSDQVESAPDSKKKKKKSSKKKKKKKSSILLIDKMTGKIIRKKRKIKDRHRVVRKDQIKNARDFKPGLEVFNEGDEESSRNGEDDLEAHDTEQGLEEDEYESDDSESDDDGDDSSVSDDDDEDSEDDKVLPQSFSTRSRLLALLFLAVVCAVGLGVILVFFVFSNELTTTKSETTSKAPSPSAPSQGPQFPLTTSPTQGLTNVPTTTRSPTQLPTITARPTSTPAPTSDYLGNLTDIVAPYSPDVLLPGSQQYWAVSWMVNNDSFDWIALTNREIVERYVMILFYNLTAGDLWTFNLEWLSAQSVCEWYGIKCSLDGVVSDLILNDNGLFGSLPTELFLLSDLVTLSLNFHSLEGTLPTEIGILTKLTGLFMGTGASKLLQGEIPTEIGRMTALRDLHLTSNGFTGLIASEIGQLTNLMQLELNENSLEGNIPSEIGLLTGLTTLGLSGNNLGGEIPAEIIALSNVTYLSMGDNLLEGALPENIDLLSSLVSLSLGTNLLTNRLPTKLGLLPRLAELLLDGNRLMGPIPTELGQISTLNLLFLGTNRLTGAIPSELGLLTDLTWLDLTTNVLTGTVPVEVMNLMNKTMVDYAGNAII